MADVLVGVSRKVYGGLVTPYIDYFEGLRTNLKKTRVGMTAEDYLCTVIFCAFPLAFAASLLLFSVLFAFATQYAAYSLSLAVLMSLMCSAATFLIGYEYPSFSVKGLKNKINKSLPFATLYMATAAKSGINPVDIFKMLSMRREIIGKEAERIYNSVKYMGMSLTTALQRAAVRTPSEGFADLLYGMVSVIGAGGDLESYLSTKTKALFADYRRGLSKYASDVSLYAEIYITLVIVGSILFTVLLSILSPMVGGPLLFFQSFIVFIFTPLVSVAFIFILKAISPEE